MTLDEIRENYGIEDRSDYTPEQWARAVQWQNMLDSVGTYDTDPKDKIGRPIYQRGSKPTAFQNYEIPYRRTSFNL